MEIKSLNNVVGKKVERVNYTYNIYKNYLIGKLQQK